MNIIGQITKDYGLTTKRCVVCIMLCSLPCSTNRDGVHTPESVVHTVLLNFVHSPSDIYIHSTILSH